MKVDFFNSDFMNNIKLIPETIDEAKQLLQFYNNTKKQPPQILINFSCLHDSGFNCEISTYKLDKSKQENFIRKEKKK